MDTSKEAKDDLPEARSRRLDTMVAICVALISTFMGICKLKDDNIVQAMQQAQVEKLDNWSFFQARNIRQEIADAELSQLRLARHATTDAARADLEAAIKRYEALSASQEAKKNELMLAARADEARYNALNLRDDQFDLSDALLTIAIAMLAVTALTSQWWLFWVSTLPMAGGVLMGLAGLLQWDVHSQGLSQLLS